MTTPKTPSRRGFTVKSALALLAGTTTSLTACDDGPTASTDVAASVSGAVSANHGHTAVITGAQLTAGSMLLLDTRGPSDHPHTVELSMTEAGR